MRIRKRHEETSIYHNFIFGYVKIVCSCHPNNVTHSVIYDAVNCGRGTEISEGKPFFYVRFGTVHAIAGKCTCVDEFKHVDKQSERKTLNYSQHLLWTMNVGVFDMQA